MKNILLETSGFRHFLQMRVLSCTPRVHYTSDLNEINSTGLNQREQLKLYNSYIAHVSHQFFSHIDTFQSGTWLNQPAILYYRYKTMVYTWLHTHM